MNAGRKINDLIIQNGMNVKQLAEKIGVAPTTIYSVITRDSNRMDVDLLIKIAHALGVTADYLIDGPDDVSHSNTVVDSLNLTKHERDLIIAYRNHPDQQASVDKLLDLPTVAKNAPVDKNATA